VLIQPFAIVACARSSSTFRTRLRCFFGAVALILCSTGPVAAGGVTVITHGFNSNVTDWIIPMAGKVGGYPGFPGATYSCYQISITRNGSGQYLTAATLIGGVPPLLTDSGEIVVKLDWSTLSSLGGPSTTTIAQVAVSALLSTTLIPDMGGRPLAELPLHLVGHSRGGSVITEMARLLGAEGIWVDQVSTLDPRPVSQFGDASVTSWVNVLFADNFWQTMGDGLIVPNGQSVFGAYNRKLLVLGGGYSSSHSDVHLWYHGTIDLATPTSDTQANITASERSTWWTSTEMSGAAAGFLYSLIGGGDRLTNLEPGGAGTGRIIDGFNKNWDLGGGVAANRTALPANSGSWPNAIRFVLATNTIPAGQSFGATLYHQAGASAAGNIDLAIFLDPDFNPYNSNEIQVSQQMLLRTGTSAVSLDTLNTTVDATAVSPGNYAVFTRLNDGGHTRYLYAPHRLIVTPGPTPTPAPTATPAPTPTPTSTPTPTPTPIPTPIPTATPPPTVGISGNVSYCSNPVPGPVSGVTLTLTGGASDSKLSDGSGNYTFTGLAAGGSYTVTPTRSALTPGSAGINTVDVIATQRHFLNLSLLSGCRLTAADVNGDSAINTVDVIAVQRFFLGLTTGIANVGKYNFSPASRTYPAVVTNQTGQNYDTLIFGDVASPFADRAGGPSQDAGVMTNGE